MCSCIFIKSKANVILVKYNASSCHAGYEVFCSSHTWHCIPKQLCAILVKQDNPLKGKVMNVYRAKCSPQSIQTQTHQLPLCVLYPLTTAVLLFFLLYWRWLTRTRGPLLVWAYTPSALGIHKTNCWIKATCQARTGVFFYSNTTFFYACTEQMT